MKVAQELGCSPQHVRNVVREEGIAVYRFGEKKQLVRVADIVQVIEKSKRAAALNKLTALK